MSRCNCSYLTAAILGRPYLLGTENNLSFIHICQHVSPFTQMLFEYPPSQLAG